VNGIMKRIFIAGVMAVAIGAAAAPASAQSVPKVELGVGYQGSHAPDAWFPLGFNTDVAITTMDKWSVVGEVGLTRHTEEEGGDNLAVKDLNFGGGVRYNGRMMPFSGAFEVIVGGLHRSFNFDECSDPGVECSGTALMIQPGVQFSYDLMENAGLMFGASYRRVFWKDDSEFSANDEGGGENDFRFVVGIKIGFPRP